jgi:hypothetical protein
MMRSWDWLDTTSSAVRVTPRWLAEIVAAPVAEDLGQTLSSLVRAAALRLMGATV